ncbi:MAG: diaminopimelate decarboxylase, partial [archaeon]
MLKAKGAKRFGLHTMIVSNELDPEYHIETAKMLFDLVEEIHKKVGIDFDFINMGGGIGIPYKPEQKAVDLEYVGRGVMKAYEEKITKKGLKPLKVFMENGRMVTGPFDYLITKAIHHKDTYKNYIGVDACMANLMRPALYGSYHHITVLGKESTLHDHKYDIVGSLCENNDKFAIDRVLPKIDDGTQGTKSDILAIHNAGAHGYAMGFNYNGKLRSAELLMQLDGKVRMIRRAETVDDYFATFNFKESKFAKK